jgi:Mor family transcriptional regulator
MNNDEIVFRLRKRIFNDWRYRGLDCRQIRDKYRVSKRWFYKLMARFLFSVFTAISLRLFSLTTVPAKIPSMAIP